MAERMVERAIAPMETEDGEGAQVRRAIGSPFLPDVDPFLLLDDFAIRPPTGFPNHPHRGFELLTYVLEGEVQHADSAGNQAVVHAGGLQKIRVGRGIVHSEFPGPAGGRGLQLWVNLPRARKQADPQYQILTPDEVPEIAEPPSRLRIVAGEGTQVHFEVPLLYWDVTLAPGTFRREVPPDWTLFTYGLAGTGLFGAGRQSGTQGQLLLWGAGDRMTVQAEEEIRFVVVGAPAIGEPVRRWGPFVD